MGSADSPLQSGLALHRACLYSYGSPAAESFSQSWQCHWTVYFIRGSFQTAEE